MSSFARLIGILALTAVLGCAAAAVETDLVIYYPLDKSVVRTPQIDIAGYGLGGANVDLLIDDQPVPRNSAGDFSLKRPLAVGKNLIDVRLVDQQGQVLDSQPLRVLRLKTFVDLDEDHWSSPSVKWLATLGVVNGYPDGTFYPNASITRAELVTWVEKIAGRGEATTESVSFNDVDPSHWAYPYIISAVQKGLVKGYPDGSFRPNNTITRVEALAVVARSEQLTKPTEKIELRFEDVSPDYWGYDIIAAAEEVGMLGYIKQNLYVPYDQASRGEVAFIVAKTQKMKRQIDKLMDFEQGYEKGGAETESEVDEIVVVRDKVIAPTPEAKPKKRYVYHYLSVGDSLVRISRQYYGSADYADEIAELNNIKSVKDLFSRKYIKIDLDIKKQ